MLLKNSQVMCKHFKDNNFSHEVYVFQQYLEKTISTEKKIKSVAHVLKNQHQKHESGSI